MGLYRTAQDQRRQMPAETGQEEAEMPSAGAAIRALLSGLSEEDLALLARALLADLSLSTQQKRTAAVYIDRVQPSATPAPMTAEELTARCAEISATLRRGWPDADGAAAPRAAGCT